MERNLTILNELKALSPLLAGIDPRTPYQVDEAYFQCFAQSLQARLAAEPVQAELSPDLPKDPAYRVPAGYFDRFAGELLARIRAGEAASPTEELSALSPLLGGLGRQMPFTTPQGYFTDFSDNVVAGVQAIEFVNEELENLSPLMNQLKALNVYTVPAGYFESLPARLLQAARRQHSGGRVVSLRSRLVRFAVAAAIFGLILLGGWLYFQPFGRNADPVATVEKGLSKMSDAEIQGYADNSTAALPDEDPTLTVNAELKEADAKDLLADVSDDELQQYLEDHGGTAATITN